MTGLQNRVFLHRQRNGIKHGLKPLSSEEREERKNRPTYIKVVVRSELIEPTEMSFVS